MIHGNHTKNTQDFTRWLNPPLRSPLNGSQIGYLPSWVLWSPITLMDLYLHWSSSTWSISTCGKAVKCHRHIPSRRGVCMWTVVRAFSSTSSIARLATMTTTGPYGCAKDLSVGTLPLCKLGSWRPCRTWGYDLIHWQSSLCQRPVGTLPLCKLGSWRPCRTWGYDLIHWQSSLHGQRSTPR